MNVFRIVRFGLCAPVLLAATCLTAQQPVPAAPIPAPILSAHKVFLANGGMDATCAYGFQLLGLGDTEPYDGFYASLQAWGHWQIVSTPADADLVLEIRVTAPFGGWGSGLPRQIGLAIYDAPTHFLLWSVTQPVKPANRKGTWQKNIAASNTALVAQLKNLTAPAVPR